VAGQC